MSQKIYEHRAQYYETDQMGIIHHSNYIRWFEEARIYVMSQAKLSYRAMEEAGILSPVLNVKCEYRTMARFDEVVQIEAALKKYNGITMTIEYTVRDKESQEIRCTGETRHCFLNKEGKPLSLKKSSPEFDGCFRQLMEESVLNGRKRCISAAGCGFGM